MTLSSSKSLSQDLLATFTTCPYSNDNAWQTLIKLYDYLKSLGNEGRIEEGHAEEILRYALAIYMQNLINAEVSCKAWDASDTIDRLLRRYWLEALHEQTKKADKEDLWMKMLLRNR